MPLCALCVLCGLSLLACPSSPPPPPPPAVDAGPSWQVVLENLQGTLLCVWGTAVDDVFAVGGSLGNGSPAVALHYDGSAWHDLHASGTETFWWAHGASKSDVWMVGTNGRIAHWDGQSFRSHDVATTATLYGVWAAAPNDAWAVGGTPEGGTKAPNDVLLHWDGSAWTPSPLPKTLGRAFFKVWGTSSGGLYVVGEAGTVWHRTGAAWNLETSGATGNLLTVHGCGASEIYAVGGRDVLVSDGKTWTRTSAQLTNDINGVSCASAGNAVIVGFGGAKQRLVGGAWQDDFGTVPYQDLHGAWADPSGDYWGAGGDFVSKPQAGTSRKGVLAFYGTTPPAGSIAP